MKLTINGHKVEVNPEDIKITKQANDIANIRTRNTNFTNSFKLPKTPANIRAMEFLSLVGNNSNVPYQKNSTDYTDDSGVPLIKDGWSIIKETDNHFKNYIYDGLIEFYKAIENRVLTDIGLEELDHLKNQDAVVNTWNNPDLPYRYNVADYNGKMVHDGKLNIDYLIPSVNMKWLFDKVFEYIGWTYDCSVLETEDFIKRWLTYPKTIGSDTEQTEPVGDFVWNGEVTYFNQDPNDLTLFHSKTLIGKIGGSPLVNQYVQGDSYAVQYPITSNTSFNNSGLLFNQTGLYKVTLDGTIYNNQPPNSQGIGTLKAQLFIPGSYPFNTVFEETWEHGVAFQHTFYVNINAGQKLTIDGAELFELYGASGTVNTSIEFVSGQQVSFTEALVDFSITDFINEVLGGFGLTPFTDAVNKHIKFWTFDEILQNTDVLNWSSKYQGGDSEKYILPGYAQKNRFSYKYNDKDANHNDGFLYINNKNIKDEAPLISSAFYSPEKNKTYFLLNNYNVYRFWNKQSKDDGSGVDYKPLENRFYVMKSELIQSPIQVTSETLLTTGSNAMYYRESFEGISFNIQVPNYYSSLYSILNKSKVTNSKFNLNTLDIVNSDFKKLVYIKQKGSYFIQNKISNFQKGKKTNVELINVSFSNEFDSELETPAPQIILTSGISEPDVINNYFQITNDYVFLNYNPISATITANQIDVSGNPTGLSYTGNLDLNSNNYNFDFPSVITSEAGWYEIYITDSDGLQSNIQAVYIPESTDGGSNEDAYISVLITGQEEHGYTSTLRDITYTFHNFSPDPASATLKIWSYNFLSGQPEGPLLVDIPLVNLAADIPHLLDNYNVGTVSLWLYVKIETPTLTHEQQVLVL